MYIGTGLVLELQRRHNQFSRGELEQDSDGGRGTAVNCTGTDISIMCLNS